MTPSSRAASDSRPECEQSEARYDDRMSDADRPRQTRAVPRIVSIGTALPETVLPQSAVRDLYLAQPGVDRRTERIVRAVFDSAGIDTRRTVISELADALPGGSGATTDRSGGDFVDGRGAIRLPSTALRNSRYAAAAPALFAGAGADALRRSGYSADSVTHVVTVSCTGFFAPGPEFGLVRDLGLPAATQRYHLGFQGCAAAVPALRMAAQFCEADARAVVLVVAAELCSLHLQPSTHRDQLVSSAIFADGAAAAVVSAAPVERASSPQLEIARFDTVIASEGEDEMRWSIADAGFDMTLTPEVPRIVGREVEHALSAHGVREHPPEHWAVHPGGRSILDRVEHALDLAPDALDASRSVLRRYGNMSSATILFVLRELLEGSGLSEGERLLTVAFGPGLTVESASFTVRTGEA